MAGDFCSITLAAGAGRRMPADMPPKPCCRIGPVTVIENALGAYERAGIDRHVVVVGCRAEEVIREASRTGRAVLFAYQETPRGTGDAVRAALDLLAKVGPPEHVLICSGDRVVAPHVIRGLVETYLAESLDFALVAGDVADNPSSGRIVLKEGRPTAILELPDIRLRQLARELSALAEAGDPVPVGRLREALSDYLQHTNKWVGFGERISALVDGADGELVPCGRLAALAAEVPGDFELRSGTVPVDEAAGTGLCNLSVYVGRFDPLRAAVGELDTRNVQGECYFTDVVDILAAAGRRLGVFRAPNAQDVMAFNTLEELESVRRVHAARLARGFPYPSVGAWAAHFAEKDPQGMAARAAEMLASRIGRDRRAIVVRSPGRINLMGRHVDHQGGTCNLMAIDREIVIVASPREDGQINLWNAACAEYPPTSFTFEELVADIVWEDWLRTLDSQYIQRLVSRNAGHWSNYAKGAALRLQHRFPDRRLRGMDACVCGNIPVGAGLSSSSALVVAVAEALVEINALNLRPREFVDLCGEGEWFVGTRGGSGDHAAIKFGRANEVVGVSFFPFRVLGAHPFPPDCSLLVCHSGLSAKKTENARERFNARVACYHMARELIRRDFPRFAPRIRHLRDVNCANLDLSPSGLYALLKHLPMELPPSEVRALAEEHPTVAKCVSSLDIEAHTFPLRDVALFGLAECERAAMTGSVLDRNDSEMLGRLMNVSHDGDRVARWTPERTPFASRATDEKLDALIADAARLKPLAESGVALWQQPGAYGCSMPEIDLMVDRSLACEGVLGAQLAGAGLGGCIMVLARQDATDRVREVLLRGYYEPRGIEPAMFVCRPSQGSQVLTSIASPAGSGA